MIMLVSAHMIAARELEPARREMQMLRGFKREGRVTDRMLIGIFDGIGGFGVVGRFDRFIFGGRRLSRGLRRIFGPGGGIRLFVRAQMGGKCRRKYKGRMIALDRNFDARSPVTGPGRFVVAVNLSEERRY